MEEQTAAKIFQALGELTASVDLLRRDFERTDIASSANRKLVYERLGAIEDRVTAVENGVTVVTSGLTNDVMPVVAKVRVWEQRGIGFLAAAGMVGTALGVGAAGWIWSWWDKAARLVGH